MEYDAIIIGAGAGGLSAGVSLSAAGKKVLVLEKLPVPGGFATTFSRKGFVFESALHCIDSLQEGGEVRDFLAEHGIAEKIGFIPLKDFSRVIYPGHDFILAFSRDDFIAYLKQEFTGESRGIDRLFGAFDKFYRQFDGFQDSRMPLVLRLFLTPFIYPEIIRASMATAEGFIARYVKEIKLKGILTSIWSFMGLAPARLSAFYFLLVFRFYYYVPAFYIRGGSSELFKAMVAKIREAGSEVRFSTAAARIVTGDGKAVKAVVTDKGEIFKAGVVISNANPMDTFGRLIDDPGVKEAYRRKLAGLEKSISAFQVYLGLKKPAQALGMEHFMLSLHNSYDHNENFAACLAADYDHCSLAMVDHARLDPGLVPAGKGGLIIMTLDSYANWEGLSPAEYKRRKEAAAQKLIKRCEKYLPGLADHIEVMEIATPRTMERYGSSPEGAIYGFAQTAEQSALRRLPRETRVKGLYLAGSWTQPGGGIHACFISGIEAAHSALRFLDEDNHR